MRAQSHNQLWFAMIASLTIMAAFSSAGAQVRSQKIPDALNVPDAGVLVLKARRGRANLPMQGHLRRGRRVRVGV
jgi:hypothetical protein